MECNDAAAAPPAASWEAGGSSQPPPQCPDGFRILAVDDDIVCLHTIVNMSTVCHYKVTTCKCAVDAVEILRRNKNEFHIVLCNQQDIDVIALQEIAAEMGLPLIFMSANDGNDDSKNGCDSLTKPLRYEDFKNIWRYVLRKKEKNACLENSRGSKEVEERRYCSGTKKRVIWAKELHQQFLEAVNTLGVQRAVPKKILELMNVSWLTRENVASHLQKYRLCLKKRSKKEDQNRAPAHFQGASGPYNYQGFANYTTHNFPPRRARNVFMDITNTGGDNFYHPYVPNIMPTKMQETDMTPSLGTSSSYSCNALIGHDNSLYQHQPNSLDGTISEHDLGQQMYIHGVANHNMHENCMNTAYGTYPQANSFEAPILALAHMIQGAENVVPDYDTSNEFPQSINQDGELPNVNHSYGSGQVYVTEQNNMGIDPSISAYQDFPGTLDFPGHDSSQGQGSGQDDLDMLMLQSIQMDTVEEDGDP